MRFSYIYNDWVWKLATQMQPKTSALLKVFCRKEPCSCPCTSIPRILGLRTSHESSSPF